MEQITLIATGPIRPIDPLTPRHVPSERSPRMDSMYWGERVREGRKFDPALFNFIDGKAV